MKRNIYASLELGSHSLKLLVSEFFQEKQNILFIDEIKSRGVQAGLIVDKSMIYTDLKKLIAKCESFIQGKVQSIVLMLPSVDFYSKEVNYDITIPENRVRGKHIKNLFNKIYTEEKKVDDPQIKDKEIAFIYPNKFTSLKMKKNIENPIGEMTRELFVNMEVFYESHPMVFEFLSVIEQLNLEVLEIMPSVVGYKKSLLTHDESLSNTCVVDIGAQTVTMTYFSNQLLVSSESFKIGSEIVTDALAERFTLEKSIAEDFKITHGNCLAKEATQEIVFEQRFADGSITYITNEYLAQIVEEKYLEIIRVIRRYLLEKGLKNKIDHYVLIGGGVAIENFEKLFKHNFGENVAIRTPNLIGTRHSKYSSIISGQYNILYLEKLFEDQYEMISFNQEK